MWKYLHWKDGPMTKRFFISAILATLLTLLLFAATALFANGTQAGPVAAPGYALAVQGEGKTGADEQAYGTWSDIAPLPTISVDEFYPCEPTPCTPQGLNVPARIKRGAGAAYPPNGKVYLFGGRHGLDSIEDFPLRWIFEYDPTVNTWTRKTALLDGKETRERYVANMVAAVLTDTSGPRIYVVGGSSIDSVPTPKVRVYNPTADSIATLPVGDNWPANPARVPGGSAVYQNKLYVFGGFSSLGAGAVFSGTWRFDPMAPSGSRWTQMANLNVPRGYIAGAVVDGKLYAIGGNTWNSVTRQLVPNNTVEMLDLSQPSPTWVTVASLPTARGDLRAWAYDTGTGYEISGMIMVAGGPYPTPDGNAYRYDPTVNSWSTVPSMLHPTRNFASAQLNGYLYALGGYDYSGGTPNGANFAQRYDARTPLGSPTPTPTGTIPTATRTSTHTNTPSVTPTVCSANYAWVATTGTIVPGTTDIGNHTDDGMTFVSLPFPVSFYEQTYNSINVSSNGNAQFVNNDGWYDNDCLYSTIVGDYGIAPYFDDLRTDGENEGIFTLVQGSAPNRIFYIEWRAEYYDTADPANIELVLYENGGKIEFIYGKVILGNSSSTVGLQKNTGTFAQYACNGTGGAITPNLRLVWTQVACPTATTTVTPTRTNTATLTPTRTATSVSEPTATSCPVQFTDVLPGSTFYTNIRCLACRDIINGYTTGCETGNPCFRPGNLVTRGQLAKIVSNSAGFFEPTGGQQFEDVPLGSTFFDFVWRLADRGIINGYPCGGPGEPCIAPNNRPYFRPSANITRGQISKIVAEAAGLTQSPGAQQFEDVPPGHTFYDYIWRLTSLGYMNGYPCGGIGEPCVPPGNLPYFRPGASATRGQASKIVANTFFPGCDPAVR
jgi:N-acetylneuraminic acid mutarotase